MKACFALMLGFETDPGLQFDAALVRGRDISWISVNSSKPGRAEAPTLLIHSTNAYATTHLNEPLDEIRSHLAEELEIVSGVRVEDAVHCDLHRWRYANIDQQHGEPALLDPETRLGDGEVFDGECWYHCRP